MNQGVDYADGRSTVLARRSPLKGRSRPVRARDELVWLFVTLVASAVGIALIVWSYRLSATNASGNANPTPFFLGIACLFAPLAAAQTFGPRPVRLLSLPAIGVASYIAQFVRAPNRPYLGDEFAHYGQAVTMYRTGRLFPPNASVKVSGSYPGFEVAVNTIREVTGLSVFRSGTILLVILHICAVMAIYEIASYVATPRIAGLAALIYALSPQFVSFDGEFSYESLGIPLTIIGLAIACRATRERDRTRRTFLLVILGAVTFAAITTHHASSFALAACLIVLGIGAVLVPETGLRKVDGATLIAIGILASTVAVVWGVLLNAHLGPYLLTQPRNALETLYEKVTGTGPKGGRFSGGVAVTATRAPLSGAGKPLYEVLMAESTPVVWLVLCVTAVWKRRRSWTPTWVLAVALAAGYFSLLPLLFVASAQSTAHRSWAITYVGLAVVGGTGATAIYRGLVSRIAQGRGDPNGRARVISATMVLVAVTPFVLAVSAYGTGVDVLRTFPGPNLLESDGRDVPNEAFQLAAWIEANGGRGELVLSDHLTSEVVDAFAGSRFDSVLSADLLLGKGPIPPTLVDTVRGQVSYIILNNRLLTQVSATAYYVWPYEPPGSGPLIPERFHRLLDASWTGIVHRTAHYVVLEVHR